MLVFKSMSRPAHDYSSWFNIPLCNHSFFYPKKIMTLQRSAETGASVCVLVKMVFLHAEFTTQASNCVTSFGFGWSSLICQFKISSENLLPNFTQEPPFFWQPQDFFFFKLEARAGDPQDPSSDFSCLQQKVIILN